MIKAILNARGGQFMLFALLGAAGTAAMFSSHGLGTDETTMWDEVLVWGGWLAMMVGLCGVLGVAIELVIREIRDIWREGGEDQDAPRRRRRARRGD